MADTNARERLVRLLDDRIFSPILNTPVTKYSGNDRQKFERVRGSMQRSRDRYYFDYDTAEEVREQYQNDLQSAVGRRISSLSQDLGLPTMNSVRDEFDRLCRDLRLGTGHAA